MSEEVTSKANTYDVNGSDRTFRTVTTHANESVQKVIIQENISKDLYDERNLSNPDLVSTDGNRYYTNILTRTRKSDGSYTSSKNIYTDLDFEKAITSSITSENRNRNLLFKINTDTVNALKSSTNKSKFLWRESFADEFKNVSTITDQEDTSFSIDGSNFGIQPSNIKTDYEDLKYPEDISQAGQDVVRFSMFRQTGRSFSFDLSTNNVFNFGKRTLTDIQGSVTLPIQNDIQDTNQVDYQRGNLNPVTGSLASLSLNPGKFGETLAAALSSDTSTIRGIVGSTASQNMINALKVYLAQAATRSQGLIPRTTGAILNPNIELLLQAPQLRSFRFSFRMSARSSTEAAQIKKIIRFFKQGMSVKESSTSLFLVTPNLFKIRYLANGNNGTEHPSIGRIKDCALTSLNTQYTPDGTYMTYNDPARTMTSYNISMEFTELNPILETDYTGGTGPLANSDEVIFPVPESQIGY